VQTLLHINTFDQRIARKYVSSCLSILSEIMLVEHEKLPAFAEKTIDLVLLYMVKPDLWRTQQKSLKKAEED